MHSLLKQYFLFLTPYILAEFCFNIATAFFTPEYEALDLVRDFPRLGALVSLTRILYFLGFYELAKQSRDKLIIALAAIVLIANFNSDLTCLFTGIRYYSLAIVDAVTLIAPVVICIWMLIRINRVKKIVPTVIIALVAFVFPLLVPKLSDHATPLTEFLASDAFLQVWGTLPGALIVAVLGLYLRYCIIPKKTETDSGLTTEQ